MPTLISPNTSPICCSRLSPTKHWSMQQRTLEVRRLEVLHVPTTRDQFISIGHANKCGLHLVLLRSNLPNDETLCMIARIREAINRHPKLAQSGLRIFVLFLDKLQAYHSPTRDKKSKRTPVIATDHIGAACAGGWVVGIQSLAETPRKTTAPFISWRKLVRNKTPF